MLAQVLLKSFPALFLHLTEGPQLTQKEPQSPSTRTPRTHRIKPPHTPQL